MRSSISPLVHEWLPGKQNALSNGLLLAPDHGSDAESVSVPDDGGRRGSIQAKLSQQRQCDRLPARTDGRERFTANGKRCIRPLEKLRVASYTIPAKRRTLAAIVEKIEALGMQETFGHAAGGCGVTIMLLAAHNLRIDGALGDARRNISRRSRSGIARRRWCIVFAAGGTGRCAELWRELFELRWGSVCETGASKTKSGEHVRQRNGMARWSKQFASVGRAEWSRARRRSLRFIQP